MIPIKEINFFSSFRQIFENVIPEVSSHQNRFSKKSILLSDVVWALMPTSDNFLNFYANILSLSVGAVKDLKNGWNTK